eukprot:scaffold7387_cov408-Prasinococcus_capsulatus_cf.AAC.17
MTLMLPHEFALGSRPRERPVCRCSMAFRITRPLMPVLLRCTLVSPRIGAPSLPSHRGRLSQLLLPDRAGNWPSCTTPAGSCCVGHKASSAPVLR